MRPQAVAATPNPMRLLMRTTIFTNWEDSNDDDVGECPHLYQWPWRFFHVNPTCIVSHSFATQRCWYFPSISSTYPTAACNWRWHATYKQLHVTQLFDLQSSIGGKLDAKSNTNSFHTFEQQRKRENRLWLKGLDVDWAQMQATKQKNLPTSPRHCRRNQPFHWRMTLLFGSKAMARVQISYEFW